MLLSLAWVSCKKAATTESTEQTAEVLTVEALAANKTAALDNLTQIQGVVAAKVTEVETALTTASEDAKAGLTTQLENLKKFQADLQTVGTKIGEATAENWESVSTEIETLQATIKSTLTGTSVDGENSTISK